jgi:UDP-glucose 4-epimerase
LKRTALVTGAHGFIGRHVARRFAEAGYEVRGIGHGAWDCKDFSGYGITFWHQAHVHLESLVTYGGEPDVIAHCAGSGAVMFSMNHPLQDFDRTVSSTAAVLEYVRLHSPGSSVVYPSSAAVYGNAETLPIREGSPKEPISHYGVHKLLAERLCQSYASNFQVPVAIVRFFSVYGKGLKKQLLWDACSRMSSEGDRFFGTGSELRDWLHVEDAARLLLTAASHASGSCPIVNGGSGQGTSVREILSMVFQEFALQHTPRFSGEARIGDPPGYQADTQMAASWGWEPEIPLTVGIKGYVDWFKKG